METTLKIQSVLQYFQDELARLEEDLRISNEQIALYMTSNRYSQRNMDAMEKVNLRLIQAVSKVKNRIQEQEEKCNAECYVAECKGCKGTMKAKPFDLEAFNKDFDERWNKYKQETYSAEGLMISREIDELYCYCISRCDECIKWSGEPDKKALEITKMCKRNHCLKRNKYGPAENETCLNYLKRRIEEKYHCIVA